MQQATSQHKKINNILFHHNIISHCLSNLKEPNNFHQNIKRLCVDMKTGNNDGSNFQYVAKKCWLYP